MSEDWRDRLDKGDSRNLGSYGQFQKIVVSPLSRSSLEDTTNSLTGSRGEIESVRFYSSKLESINRFFPAVDYSKPENFARYGLAEQYYIDSYTRIYRSYPYDGSLHEREQWKLSSSYLDLYLFEHEYPRTTGYLNFSPSGWGTLVGSLQSSYGLSNDVEYVYFTGGPHADRTGDFKSEYSLANVYDKSQYRQSNLKFSENQSDQSRHYNNIGNTIEFWLKKDGLVYETNSALGQYEVIFDSYASGSSAADANHLRTTVAIDGATSKFRVTYASGSHGSSVGLTNVLVGTATGGSLPQLKDGKWHHYAITLCNDIRETKGHTRCRLYVDGKFVSELLQDLSGDDKIAHTDVHMVATIGSLATSAYESSTVAGLGWSKLSGSIDEFRFWKSERTDKEIGQNWFVQHGGGTNTDTANTTLGVYYKFNEGVTLTSSVDSTVLDYSGRVSNGRFVGYKPSTSRNTGSAIESYDSTLKEYRDPIIYNFHPQVLSSLSALKISGSSYDRENNASIFFGHPNWMIKDDFNAERSLFRELSQIIASYFDNLHMQIESLPKLKNVTYNDFAYAPHLSGSKPLPFSDKLLTSAGFIAPEIFTDAELIEYFLNRDEDRNYEQELSDVKNQIYKNIYNNLVNIYKTKGTEKSFRNLIRCFGVDRELIKFNVYGDNYEYDIGDKYRYDADKIKAISFNDISHYESNIIQATASDGSGTSYVSGATTPAGLSFTAECDYIAPKIFGQDSRFFNDPVFNTGSVFGCHTPLVQDNHSLYTTASGKCDLQVYTVKPELKLDQAYFCLSSSNQSIPLLTSSLFPFFYTDKRWNLSLRLRPSGYPFSNLVSGSDASYILEFAGRNHTSDKLDDSFLLTASLSRAAAQELVSSDKRFYVGAQKENFTGSVVKRTNALISSLRFWQSYLTDDELNSHAMQLNNFGRENAVRNEFDFEFNYGNVDVPKIATLALYWDFTNVTSSFPDGTFVVEDLSSGSVPHTQKSLRYNKLSGTLEGVHFGRGHGFTQNSNNMVKGRYYPVAVAQLPEIVYTPDQVKISETGEDAELFTPDSRPVTFYHAFEKSMYQTISEEMLKYFSTVSDFNNLIGEPVNRYRQQYKDFRVLRGLFFEKIGNEPDLDRYVTYFKWIDSALSEMLNELVPASLRFSDGIDNIIESHVLERSKYWTKFPTFEFRSEPPEGNILGVNELLYDWHHGHAPIDLRQSINCLWWKDRANRNHSLLTTSASLNPAYDSNKEEIRKVYRTETSGSKRPRLNTKDSVAYEGGVYVTRKLSKPYKFSVKVSKPIHAGSNSDANKKYNFYKGVIHREDTSDTIVYAKSTLEEQKDCLDVIAPDSKERYHILGNTEGNEGYLDADSDFNAPFNFHSASVEVGYVKGSGLASYKQNLEINDLHFDSYGDDKEIPLQSPFTQQHVGGQPHRSVEPLYATSSVGSNVAGQDGRPEAFDIKVDSNNVTVGEMTASAPKSMFFRDGLARRPVNIANIKTNTSNSRLLGNYDKPYEIIQSHGRSNNNVDFAQKGGYTYSFYDSTHVDGLVDESVPSRTRKSHVFVNRFSPLGSPGQSIREREVGEYSVYSTVNYRNFVPRRRLLDKLYSEHSNQFGARSGSVYKDLDYAVTSSLGYHAYASPPAHPDHRDIKPKPNLSIHKTNRNTRYRPDDSLSQFAAGAWTNLLAPAQEKDNFFVSHPIPQNDLQVSWILASTLETTGTFPGLQHDYTIPANSTDSVFQAEMTFPTSSEIGVHLMHRKSGSADGISESTRLKFGSLNKVIKHIAETSYILSDNISGSFLPVDFVGLDSIVHAKNNVTSSFVGSHSDNYHGFSHFNQFDEPRLASIYLNIGQEREDENEATGTPVELVEMHEDLYSRINNQGVEILNSMILNRQGPYGWPSWKQLRSSQSPLVREMKSKNIYSFVMGFTTGEDGSITLQRSGTLDVGTINYYKEYLEAQEGNLSATGEVPEALRARFGIKGYVRSVSNYIESPISSKYYPLEYGYGVDTTRMQNATDRVMAFEDKDGDSPLLPLLPTPRQRWPVDCWFASLDFSADMAYGNHMKYFSNPSINSLFVKNYRIPDVRARYEQNPVYMLSARILFDRALRGDNIHPDVDNVPDYVAYKETVYPKDKYSYLELIRDRVLFKNDFWRDAHLQRQAELNGSTGYFTYQSDISFRKVLTERFEDIKRYRTNSLGVDSIDEMAQIRYISQSIWPLDARFNFVGHPVDLTASFPKIANGNAAVTTFEARDQARRFAGELQNDYSIFHMGINNLHVLPPAAPVYSRRIPQRVTISGTEREFLAGEAQYQVSAQALREPFYDSYESYREEVRVLGQDHTLIPEFKISDHISEIYHSPNQVWLTEDAAMNTTSKNPLEEMFSITGATYQTSKHPRFMEVYSYSDMLEHFDFVRDFAQATENDALNLSMRCRAVLKLLPYEGFYPALRTTQMAGIFAQEYTRDSIRFRQGGDQSDFRPYYEKKVSASLNQVMKPLFAPGILYNSIKSGLAVDYPIFTVTSSATIINNIRNTTLLNSNAVLRTKATASSVAHGAYGYLDDADSAALYGGKHLGGITGSWLNSTEDSCIPRISASLHYRIPFEAIMMPDVLDSKIKFFDNEPHPSASLFMGGANWGKIIDYPFMYGKFHPDSVAQIGADADRIVDTTVYSLAANNFVAESIDLFLKDGKLTTLSSKRGPFTFPSQIRDDRTGETTANPIYKMRLYLVNRSTSMYDRDSAFGPPVDGGRDEFSVDVPFAATPGVASLTFTRVPYADPLDKDFFEITGANGNSAKIVVRFSTNGTSGDECLKYNPCVDTSGPVGSNTTGSFFVKVGTPYGIDYLNTSTQHVKALSAAITSKINSISYLNVTSSVIVQNGLYGIELKQGQTGTAGNTVITQGHRSPYDWISTNSSEKFENGRAAGSNRVTINGEVCHSFDPYVPQFLKPADNLTLEEDELNAPYVEFSYNPFASSDDADRIAVSVDRLLSKTTITSDRSSGFVQQENTTSYQNIMTLSASLNLFTTVEDNESQNRNALIRAIPEEFLRTPRAGMRMYGSDEGPRGVSAPLDIRKRWVIYPKWETPIFDFSTVKSNALDLTGSQILEVDNSPWNIPSMSGSYYLTSSRGMWHQYKEKTQKNGNGYFLVCKDVDGFGSLADIVGFTKSPVQLGEPRKSKRISECVVAVPFVRGGAAGTTRPEYFKINPFRSGFDLVNHYDNGGSVPTSVKHQIEAMRKFIFPPSFDFVKFPQQVPFVMFTFEFSTTLNEQDITDMWQNLPPRIATNPRVTDSKFMAHSLQVSDKLESINVEKDIYWHMFKVKQRASKSYSVKIKESIDGQKYDDSLSVDFSELSMGTSDLSQAENSLYSYNWPYDYFSLVELVKFGAKIDFKRDREMQLPEEVPETPPGYRVPDPQDLVGPNFMRPGATQMGRVYNTYQLAAARGAFTPQRAITTNQANQNYNQIINLRS